MVVVVALHNTWFLNQEVQCQLDLDLSPNSFPSFGIWAHPLMSLNLSFFICKMRLTVPTFCYYLNN